jgi:hypothetical protein
MDLVGREGSDKPQGMVEQKPFNALNLGSFHLNCIIFHFPILVTTAHTCLELRGMK